MNLNSVKFDFNDILICPAVKTTIPSREGISTYYPGGSLPIAQN